MKNTLADLNDHLFLQIERINDEDLSGDRLKEEVTRTFALRAIAREVISNADLAYRAALGIANCNAEVQTPTMLETSRKNKKTLPME